MASFPDSAKTFASRSNGQVIDAAHVGDLQDEVAAIESGYLTGTARLNSSHSTVVALSVTGASTFTSRPSMPPPEAVRVYAETVTAVSSAGVVIRSFTAQEFITNSSLHSTATNSSRVTPQSTGLFEACGQIRFSSNSTGSRGAQILDSSGAVIGETRIEAGVQIPIVQVTGIKRFDVLGGYLRLQAVQTDASTLSASTGAGNTWFQVVKL